MHRINGEPLDVVPLLDRGLQYGDGIFTTLKVVGGRPVFWARHHARLTRDAARLNLPCPAERDWLRDIESLVGEHGDGVVKCLLTRGGGGRGYRLPSPTQPRRIVSWYPPPIDAAESARKGVAVRVCRLRVARQPALAGLKHLNRLENVVARMEWDDPDIAEGLLLDEFGSVIEGTMSNLFWRIGGRWETPSLDHAGVAGVIRAWIMDELGASGDPVKCVEAGLERVLLADEVFICNSLMGIVPVASLSERRWNEFPATRVLQLRLREKEHAL